MSKNFEGVFIAPTATVVGNVTIYPGSSVWFGAVVRGDVALIQIGRNTSIQDNAVIHVKEGIETLIGNQVTIGHGAIVHGAQIEDNVLVGIGAIILDRARVGEGSVIGAGAVVTEGTQVPRRSLVLGVPGKVAKEVTEEQFEWITANAKSYTELAERYLRREQPR
ncbi:MAG TPA: gamma carbonic anhydrase family protein [Candidatus Bathyarchaeia archaeon]|nr:gamma carbonic anhydrase family protein [Candidatus Bathyarchaeia archaeon]